MAASARWCAPVLALTIGAAAVSLTPASAASPRLKYVVIISRHGVRAPTWDTERLNQYSSEPWPDWGVGPGELTPHGAVLMKAMGSYYRAWLSSEGLHTTCGDRQHVYVWADSGQRTLESGRALGEGWSPACPPPVHSLPAGTPDPLFDPIAAGVVTPDLTAAANAVRTRIGSDADLIATHRSAFDTLNNVLATRTRVPAKTISPPASISVAVGATSVELSEPFAVASTLTENFLLEYANGMRGHELGWGRLNEQSLFQVLQLHGLYADLMRRTPYLARVRGSNLLAHVLRSMRQAVDGTPLADALGTPHDAVLVLSGHDTNLSNLAGMLGLSWTLPGYQADDTPPGGALVFSIWQENGGSGYAVAVRYVAQTLTQMREATPLSLASPPAQQDLAIPGCGAANARTGCPWPTFARVVQDAIDGHGR